MHPLTGTAIPSPSAGSQLISFCFLLVVVVVVVVRKETQHI